MARQKYQRELETHRQDVYNLSLRVEDLFQRSLEALEKNDNDPARSVIKRAEDILERGKSLDTSLFHIGILQQPVAGDARFVSGSRFILEYEMQITIQTANLSHHALNFHAELFPKPYIEAITDNIEYIFDEAISAYLNKEGQTCLTLSTDFDETDALCEKALEIIREKDADAPSDESSRKRPRHLGSDQRMILIIKTLRLIANYAMKIAGRTRFIVTGDRKLLHYTLNAANSSCVLAPV